MHQLVAQGVDAVEQHTQHRRSVAPGQGVLGHLASAGESIGPLGLGDPAALEAPETLEHLRVVEHRPDDAGELRPHMGLDAFRSVQGVQLAQEGLERQLLGEAALFVNVRGVGGVKVIHMKMKRSFTFDRLVIHSWVFLEAGRDGAVPGRNL